MKERLLIAGALAAVAVVMVLSLAVFEFGIRHPSPPSLEKDPNPAIPGEILYRSDDSCLVRALASGAGSRREICMSIIDRYGPMSWASERTVVFREGADLVAYDLETGGTVAPPPGLAPSAGAIKGVFEQAVAPSGEAAMVDGEGRLLVINGTEKVEIADFDVDEYRLSPMIWSPDSQWILLRYQPPRGGDNAEIWIVSRDGRTRGTFADDLRSGGQASWRIEGVGVTPAFGAR